MTSSIVIALGGFVLVNSHECYSDKHHILVNFLKIQYLKRDATDGKCLILQKSDKVIVGDLCFFEECCDFTH